MKPKWNIIALLFLGAFASRVASQEETTVANTQEGEQNEDTAETTDETKGVKCYACGQSGVDPIADDEKYCDLEKGDECAANTKMYNHTCDIMDRLGPSESWVRECPTGVRSCFYAQGRYLDQKPTFRGCAGAMFPHDEKCTRQLQAVQVVAGKTSVDVEVNLCYCNSDTCNEIISGANAIASSVTTIVTIVISLILARVA